MVPFQWIANICISAIRASFVETGADHASASNQCARRENKG